MTDDNSALDTIARTAGEPVLDAEAAIRRIGVYVVAQALGRSPAAIKSWLSMCHVPASHEAKFLLLCEQKQVLWRPSYWDPCVQLRLNPKANRRPAGH